MQCPIILKSEATSKVRDLKIGDNFNSDAPSVFIGHYGYPNLNVGLLTPPEKKDDTWLYDAPRTWANSNFTVPQVVNYRSGLVNSRFKAKVNEVFGKQDSSRLLNIAQEVSQASKPVDLEINLNDKPKVQMHFDAYTAPMGPHASVKKVDITSNPFIDKQVEKRVSDTDLLSTQAVNELYDKGFDENFLSKLLSVGNLGIGKKRKLVPTRWAITAVDDTIGKEMIDEIKQYEKIQPTLMFAGYLGNYYLIMMLEDVWQYELFETYMPNASWNQDSEIQYTTDFEGYEGRHDYAENCAGGYYAARLPIIQFLKEEKKQATALVIRVITGEYSCPLGVWVVREATRKALQSKKHTFEKYEQMIEYGRFILKKKFNIDIDIMLKESKIYKNAKSQIKLTKFF